MVEVFRAAMGPTSSWYMLNYAMGLWLTSSTVHRAVFGGPPPTMILLERFPVHDLCIEKLHRIN